MSDDYSPILQAIDAAGKRSTAAVRRLLVASGRQDLLEEFDKNMRDVRTGVTAAKSVWHSISPAQRRVLEIMETGRWMQRRPRQAFRYDAMGPPHAEAVGAGLKTMRALCAYGLVHVDGGATDPEASFVLTERGRFVLKRGRVAA